jgi:hypothetical protein
MKPTTRVMLVSLLALAVPGVARPAAPAEPAAAEPTARAEPAAAAVPGEDPAAREKWFTELLNNVELVGSFTTDGRDQPPREDRYTILKAVKGEGDNWVITAKVGYKGMSVPVNFTVPVKWAGDTPMIYMTNQKLPGMGAFTVRLMFYGNHYAGTWSASDHGGLMWGRIEPAGAKPTTKPTTRPAR